MTHEIHSESGPAECRPLTSLPVALKVVGLKPVVGGRGLREVTS